MQVMITSKDYLAVVGYRWLHKSMVGVLLTVVTVFACFLGEVIGPDALREIYIASLLCASYLLLQYFVVQPGIAARRYSQLTTFHTTWDLSIKPDGLRWVAGDQHNFTMWSELYRWHELNILFVVFRSTVLFQIIPKRAFENIAELDFFRHELTEKVGPENKPRAKSRV